MGTCCSARDDKSSIVSKAMNDQEKSKQNTTNAGSTTSTTDKQIPKTVEAAVVFNSMD